MTAMPEPSGERERVLFLARVIEREAAYLADTDRRLFASPMTPERASSLAADALLAERVDAFVARFARLQDTLSDKLLPALLRWLGERPGPFIDNLNLAERQGWVADAVAWFELRRLRNQMIHEYVEDLTVLADALNAAHDGVPLLLEAAATMSAEVTRRTAAD
jgi:hypothetical protein